MSHLLTMNYNIMNLQWIFFSSILNFARTWRRVLPGINCCIIEKSLPNCWSPWTIINAKTRMEWASIETCKQKYLCKRFEIIWNDESSPSAWFFFWKLIPCKKSQYQILPIWLGFVCSCRNGSSTFFHFVHAHCWSSVVPHLRSPIHPYLQVESCCA